MNQVLENYNLAEKEKIIARMKTTNNQLELYQNEDYYRLEKYMDRVGQVLIILAVLSFAAIIIFQISILSKI